MGGNEWILGHYITIGIWKINQEPIKKIVFRSKILSNYSIITFFNIAPSFFLSPWASRPDICFMSGNSNFGKLWNVWTQESVHKYIEYDRPSELTLTLRMTTVQVVETSVTDNNSAIQDYIHPDDHTQPTYEWKFLVIVLRKYR